MALTIYTGRQDLSNMPNDEYISAGAQDIMAEIEAGNTVEVQRLNELNALIDRFEKEVVGIDGQPIPVKRFNVYFAKGGIQTSAPEFRPFIDKFNMRKDRGYNVVNFTYDDDAVLDARERGVDLNSDALERVTATRIAYNNKMLPYKRMIALLAGSSESTAIPSVNADGNYTDSFGFLRGENAEDWLPATADTTTGNHYRVVTTSAGVLDTDVNDCVDLIESYDTYSGAGIIAIAHPRTVSNLSSTYADTLNQDKSIDEFIKTRNLLGVDFLSTNYMHKDLILFLDAGKVQDLLMKRVSPDPQQRGWGLVMKEPLKQFMTAEDLDGSKMRIFPTEWYMAMREAGVLLDTNGTRFHISGEMQSASETVVNAFITKLIKGFDWDARRA